MRRNLIHKRGMALRNKAFVCLLLATYIQGSRYYFEKAYTDMPRRPDYDMSADKYISEEFDWRSEIEIALDKPKSNKELLEQKLFLEKAVSEDSKLFSNLELEVCSSGVYITGSEDPKAEKILMHYTPFTYEGFVAVNSIFKRVYEHGINPHKFDIFIKKTWDALSGRGINLKKGDRKKFEPQRSDYKFTITRTRDDYLDIDLRLTNNAINSLSPFKGYITYGGGFMLTEDAAFGMVADFYVDSEKDNRQPMAEKYENSRDNNEFGCYVTDVMVNLIGKIESSQKYLSMDEVMYKSDE